jgi:hypothetical protein
MLKPIALPLAAALLLTLAPRPPQPAALIHDCWTVWVRVPRVAAPYGTVCSPVPVSY